LWKIFIAEDAGNNLKVIGPTIPWGQVVKFTICNLNPMCAAAMLLPSPHLLNHPVIISLGFADQHVCVDTKERLFQLKAELTMVTSKKLLFGVLMRTKCHLVRGRVNVGVVEYLQRSRFYFRTTAVTHDAYSGFKKRVSAKHLIDTPRYRSTVKGSGACNESAQLLGGH